MDGVVVGGRFELGPAVMVTSSTRARLTDHELRALLVRHSPMWFTPEEVVGDVVAARKQLGRCFGTEPGPFLFVRTFSALQSASSNGLCEVRFRLMTVAGAPVSAGPWVLGTIIALETEARLVRHVPEAVGWVEQCAPDLRDLSGDLLPLL